MIRKLKVTAIILLLISLVACTKFGPEQTQAWDLIDNGALVIDVRTKEEFQQGHLDYAINIEYEKIPEIVQSIGKNKQRSVVLYCRSGRRSGISMDELAKLGYSNIYNAGGLKAMNAALVEKNKSKP